MAKRLQRTYTAEHEEQGLQTLAKYMGNGHAASRELKKRGIDIPFQRLYEWRKSKAQRYGEIRAQQAPRIAEQVAAELEDYIVESSEVKRKALSHLSSRIDADPDMSISDLSNTVSRLAVAEGIATQRSSELRGRPTVIHEHRSLSDIMQAWQRKGWIDGEASEIDPSRTQSD